MLQTESKVIIADNTWAKEGLIIRILKWSNAKSATVGDKVVLAIKSADRTATYKKWEVVKAIIVRVKKEIRRSDGSYLRFSDNAAVIIDIDAKGQTKMAWKRIFGPIAREVEKEISRFAQEVI
jgi:large subunit ribosomal protein L14